MADTLTITDNRTGKSYEIPITDGTIRATDLKKITAGGDDPGLATYDPAFMNTAAVTRGSSSIAATRSSSWPRTAPTSKRRT